MRRFMPEKIAEARKKRNITQNQLAQMIGISRTYMSQIESGKFTPTVKILAKIAGSLRVKESYFFEEGVKNAKQKNYN